MKNQVSFNFLIVEDNPGDFVLLQRFIRRTALPVNEICHVESMQRAKQIIKEKGSIDLAFLDLSLPDSNGIDSFITLNGFLPQTPIIILSGLSDTKITLQAISLGAQDYLIKGEFDEKLLSKSISYSIERKRNGEKFRMINQRYEMVNKATNDTIWEWNYEANIGIWGEGLMKIFGYTEDHLIKKYDWAEEYLYPEDIEPVRKKIKYHIENKLENWQEEFRFRCADGSYKLVLDRGFIVYDEEGNARQMYGAMTDITEQRRLEKELEEHRLKQQKLITEITINAQEKERNEIGKELHDNVNQILATVKMFLNMAKDDSNRRAELVDRSFENVNHAISEIRKLSKSLVTPSLADMGLQEAVEELAEEINISGTLHIDLNFENDESKQISPGIQLMLYRIIQEAVNNILKYAKASKALIRLKADTETIILTIEDNGIGFNPSKKAKGIGLKNIKSRIEFYSGTLNIITSPGKGCTLEIRLPFKSETV